MGGMEPGRLVSIKEVIAALPGPWEPRDLVFANETVIRIARLEGGFPWPVSSPPAVMGTTFCTSSPRIASALFPPALPLTFPQGLSRHLDHPPRPLLAPKVSSERFRDH